MISSSVTSSDGSNRNAVGVTAFTTSPASRHAAATGPDSIPGASSAAISSPGAAHLGDTGQRQQRLREVLPRARGERGNVLGLHGLQHRERGASGERLAAEGGGVVAGLERRRDVLTRPTRTDRHPVAQRLGHGDDVGAHTFGVLEPEPLPRAAEARLHLVDDQQRLALVAERTHGREVAVGRGDHPALALDRLEHHRAHTRSSIAAAQRVEVPELDLAEAGRQRLEHFLLLRLAGGGERSERAAVERAVGGEHVVALGTTVRLPVATGELDRALVRLGAGVGEEHAPVAAEQRVEPGGHLRLQQVATEPGAAPRIANAARLACAAPWVVLAMMSFQRDSLQAYSSPAGVAVLLVGAAVTLVAYRLMVRIGRLPPEERVLR